MKKNTLPEEPMFPEEESIQQFEHGLTYEQYKWKSENFRKNKTLEFCFTSAKWIALIGIALIAGDFVAQYFSFETTLVKDCFSLLTYIVTAALGFIFANNSK